MINAKKLIEKNPDRVAGIQAFVFCLARCRFSVLILLAGLGLLLSDQGRDVIVAYGEDGRTRSLAVAEAIWAWSVWGWSRMLLDVNWDNPPHNPASYNFWRKWVPRVLGSLAFAVFGISAGKIGQHELAVWAAAMLLLFLVVVIKRKPVTNMVAARLGKVKLRREVISDTSRPEHESFTEMLGIPWREGHFTGERWSYRSLAAIAMFLTFFILAVISNIYPVFWMNTGTGALILFFLWASTWLPFGSWLSYHCDRIGIPLLTVLVVAALASSFTNDNHEIRGLAWEKKSDLRPTVSEAMDAWYQANIDDAKNGPPPFVVVATAGGGIRAAYWTATVLGKLQDDGGENFSRKVFAISGVSGGSVGATVYRRLLDTLEPAAEKMADSAQKVIDHDLLSPLVAALLYPDLAQRFIPFPVLLSRATAFENGLEQAFRSVTEELGVTDQTGLEYSLGSLEVAENNWKPSLFLNSTWSDNGRRIVAGNLRFGNHPNEAHAFSLSNDELAILGHDLRLSTAAHNSARFPFVSPPGMWRDKDEKIAGRLQDGGLFENYGAETALEIISLACSKFACFDEDVTAERPRIKPVVVLISSDPTLPADLAESPKNNPPLGFGYEVRSTFRTYARVRVGRGAELASQLKNTMEDVQGSFYYFRMCKNGEVGEPPLGWALSDIAQATIRDYFRATYKENPETCREKNVHAEQVLVDLLKQ
ncbi:MAG: patatin-like phospholipase family protein [Proteobacteria bacterium]|nr:patatin-like phospholipase family protein [Pseudomonadota bacterium]MBU1739671.1 patatin-like phospholipase family protein [Pseudomonadota bacterium]